MEHSELCVVASRGIHRDSHLLVWIGRQMLNSHPVNALLLGAELNHET